MTESAGPLTPTVTAELRQKKKKPCGGPPLAFFAEVFPVQITIEDVRCNGHT